MKNEWKKLKIGDSTYAFDDMSAESALLGFLKVSEAFGGIFASAMPMLGMDTGEEAGKMNVKNLLEVLDVDSIQKALTSASSSINPEKIKAVIDETLPTVFITKDTEKDGHRCTYDDFRGKLGSMFKVVAFALRFHYADFFTDLFQNGADVQGDPENA